MSPADARALLGLPGAFTRSELSAAHRRMARLVHPDRMGGAGESERSDAADLLVRIDEAMAALQRTLESGPAATSDWSPPGGDGERSRRPKPPPMTYDEFLHRSQQESWATADKASAHALREGGSGRDRYAWRASASAPPAPVRPRPGRTVLIGVLALVLVVGGLAGAVSVFLHVGGSDDARPEGGAAVDDTSGMPAGMAGEEDAGSTAELYVTWVDDPACTRGDHGCWGIHVASADGVCAAAHVEATFERTRSSVSGPTRGFDVDDLSPTDARDLEIDAPADRYQYLEVSASCTS